MRRITIFGINYAPEPSGNAPYTTGLAEYLSQRDWDVTVITGYPHYPAWNRQPAARRSTTNGVRVDRYRHYVPRSANALYRGIFELSSLLSALPAALRKRDAEVILGVVPNLSGAALARIAAWRNHTPYVLWIQDLMAQAARQGGTVGGGLVADSVEWAEIKLARKAALNLIVAESFRPYLEEHGVNPLKVTRVHNWNLLPDRVLGGKSTRLQFGLNPHSLVVLHSGNMGDKQGLEVVLDAAVLIPDMQFVLQGNGNARAHLEASVARREIGNVTFLPSLDRQDLANLLAAADVLLVTQRASVTNMSLPSKLTSYQAAEKPVLASVDLASETAAEVNAYALGMVVDAGSPERLVEALRLIRSNMRMLSPDSARHQRPTPPSPMPEEEIEILLSSVCAEPPGPT